ncbi:DUF7544 domain-containing protein [Desertihabitans brevis]|uniref:DUF7544 domain-containing protein n=1 Tax=Desertihabitans brevis TaxID=2268447 RepID=UPI0018F702AE|nr:hypothetical protein [Desertihabitans brevis]
MSYPATPASSIAPARPHGLGDVLGTAWRAMKSRYGAHLGIVLLPLLVGLVGGLVITVLVFALGLTAVLQGDPGAGASAGVGAVVLGVVGTLVFYVVLLLVALRAQGMAAVLVQQTIDGRRPSLGDLWRETRGFWGRVIPLLLLAVLAAVALTLVLGLAVGGVVAASVGLSQDTGGGAAGLGVGVATLLYLAVVVAAVWVSVKLLPVYTVLAVERLGGMTAVKRAWRLTDRNFWRTLGYTIVAQLIPQAVIYVVTFVGLAIGFGVMAGGLAAAGDSLSSGSPDAATVAPIIIGVVVMYALPLVAALFVAPFLNCFSTVYSMDLARRKATELPSPAPGTGGWVAQPYPDLAQQWGGYPSAQQWGQQDPYGGQQSGQQQAYGGQQWNQQQAYGAQQPWGQQQDAPAGQQWGQQQDPPADRQWGQDPYPSQQPGQQPQWGQPEGGQQWGQPGGQQWGQPGQPDPGQQGGAQGGGQPGQQWGPQDGGQQEGQQWGQQPGGQQQEDRGRDDGWGPQGPTR